jgi:hypothetical protein
MATASKVRKLTRAAKMREYFTAHPTATVSAVAKKFKTTYQIAYMCKKGMEPKKIVLHRAEVEIANKLGIPTAEYAKQKAKILKQAKVKAKPALWQPPALLPVPPITMVEPAADPVNHPAHYKVGGIETIDFIEAKGLTYHLGNAVKYITRADHKGNRLQDLEKARWYLDREIGNLSEKLATQSI